MTVAELKKVVDSLERGEIAPAAEMIKKADVVKYKCIENLGYEGRLTLDKVYECSLSNGQLGAKECLLVVRLDDGVVDEVFDDRFKRVPIENVVTSGPMPRKPVALTVEEGDKCPICIHGDVVIPPVEGCTCFINPPCSACVGNKLVCEVCGEDEDELNHFLNNPVESKPKKATGIDPVKLAKFKALQEESWSKR